VKAAVKNDTRVRPRGTAAVGAKRAAASPRALRIAATVAVAVALVVAGYFVWHSYRNREVDYDARLLVSPGYGAYKVGVAAASQGRLKEAEDAFNRALKDDPKNALIYNALATVQTNRLDFQTALTTAEKGYAMAPGSPDLLYTLGLTRYHLGKYRDAEQALRRALEIRPDFPRASLWLGNTYMVLAREGVEGGFKPELVDQAVEQYKAALEGGPDEADFHAAYGEALYQKRELDQARSEYQRAVELDPGNAPFRVALGKVCDQLGDFAAARESFRAAVAADRINEEAYYGLGSVLAKEGNDEEAAAALRRAIEIDRYYADAHQLLSEVLARAGRGEEAAQEAALAEATRQQGQALAQLRVRAAAEPGNADVANKLGLEYAKRGEYDEAMAQFHRALAINPKHVDAMYQIAGIHMIKGQAADALEAFTGVDKLSPGYRRTNEYLAKLYGKLGQKGKAAERERMLEKQKAEGTFRE
jgi:tetratricopeptide (TPR) repeat protein